VARRSDNDMVEDFDLEQLPGPDQVTCHLYVCLRRFRLAARVVVLCAAPAYVQSPISGTDINSDSRTKGVLCKKANHSSGLTRTLPCAR